MIKDILCFFNGINRMKPYRAQSIEKKWQKIWEKKGIYRQYARKKKFYVLDMFPYPSGAGLHVGHPKGYIATDVVARMKQMQGYGVLHPMGWDAFGLPAENYAIKNHVHPSIAVKKNVATFKKQLEKIGFTYDWNREINTTDPEFYRWTQWIFLQLYKKGLAYESHEPINWCPSCQTGLANEDLENGLCERCGSEVEKRPMRQWMLRMTRYADRLLRDLDSKELQWEESIVTQQKNWIGRSEGAMVRFSLTDRNASTQNQKENQFLEVFTTRIDTIFGCTSVVVAPEHPLVSEWEATHPGNKAVRKYIEKTKKKSELERTELGKEKTGIQLEGIEAVNPFTGKGVPIFVADYVLGNYGTGAVMAVPAHDERDAVFAKKYDLPTVQTVAPYIVMKGECTPREDKETTSKDCVTAIVLDPEKKKTIILRRKQGGTCVFPGGGIEKGEDPEEAIVREIQEETGYKNIAIERILIPALYGHGFKERKGVNCCDRDIVFVASLKDMEREGLSDEEHDTHELFWEPLDRVGDISQLGTHHAFMWRVFRSKEEIYTGDGVLIDSGDFTGLRSAEAREKMIQWLEKKKLGKKSVNYKMRDWVFSRQRYWGEPIPIVHCEKCGAVPVPEQDLPVILPNVRSYEPTGTGESPLASIERWVKTKCPKCKGPARRETNTMPQWAGSSWYYLRYIDPDNKKALVNKKKEAAFMPVDLYVGGAEHATRHLLYARFWHKFLFDVGVVSGKEPFKRLVYVGLILASDGRKMSKRYGNVINPDDIIEELGADSLRIYEMFLGPFTQNIAWNTEGVVGARRFLEKVWKLQDRVEKRSSKAKGKGLESLLHQTIKKVTEDIEEFKFNTAVSSLMILVNAMEKETMLSKENYATLLFLLSPFAPHIAEELWEKLGNKKSIFLGEWPQWDKKKIIVEEVEIVVQVNGKVRDRLSLSANASDEELRQSALASEKVKQHTDGKEIRKVIIVPGKLVSIVV